MKDIELIKKISKLDKDILTVEDLGKILEVKPSSLRTKISRLTQKEVLQRVGRGLYTVFGQVVIPEEVAPKLYYPSYLSLRTVLSKEGVVNQIPQQVYLITPRKTYQTKILETSIIYRKISKDLFFGYYLDQNIPTAYPEKALLDLIYFVSLGKETSNWNEMDFSRLDKERCYEFLKHFPSKTQRLAESVLKSEGVSKPEFFFQ